MYNAALKNPLSIKGLIDCIKWKIEQARSQPTFFRTFGTSIFCGAQGEGKTLSAVQYVLHILDMYPRAILVSNVAIKDRPFNAVLECIDEEYYIKKIATGEYINTDKILVSSMYDDYEPITLEYTGLDMLKNVDNREYGVVFLIDEIHLELNSLESKNVDIEVMVEISQQRKQRKHIVGTSQVFMRMAKPLREQIHDIIICKCWFNLIQFNKWILGETVTEKNGKMQADVKGRYLWFHHPDYYQQYDTYTKMKRYNKEWNGRKRVDNIYEKERGEVIEFKR